MEFCSITDHGDMTGLSESVANVFLHKWHW